MKISKNNLSVEQRCKQLRLVLNHLSGMTDLYEKENYDELKQCFILKYLQMLNVYCCNQ